MTLYQLNEQIQKAIELGFDPETGEILDETALEQLQMDRDEKIENICLFIKDLKAEAAALDAEKKNLDSRATVAKRKSDSLSRYLQAMLDGEKFKTSRCSVSYRKTQAVNVTDQSMIPKEFIRIKEEPDKVSLKEALKEGYEIPGAFLETRQSMIIK
jgi:hypothetical protein